jgi:hypothetical protein
MPIPR